jgi:hypothetical protein
MISRPGVAVGRWLRAVDRARRAVAPANKERLSLPRVFAKLLAYAETEGFLS